MRLAREKLSNVQDIFGTRDGITSYVPKARGSTSQGQQSQPVRVIDFPGALSRSGIRRDNDHASISDLGILPTLAEIWHTLTLSPQEMYCIF